MSDEIQLPKSMLDQKLTKTEKDRLEVAHLKNRYERMTLAQAELELISAALERNGGNVEKSARQLGIVKRTIYIKLSKLGLSPKLWRKPRPRNARRT